MCDGSGGLRDPVERLREETHPRVDVVDDGRRLVGPAGTELVGSDEKPDGAEYIGRGSPVGNPFPVGEFTREESVRRYGVWLDGQRRADNVDIETFRGWTLWCPGRCLPRRCHGIVLLNALAEEWAGQTDLTEIQTDG